MTPAQLSQRRIVVAFACKEFGTSAYILTSSRNGNNRRQEHARSFVRYMLHKYSGIPIREIAVEFGYDEMRSYLIQESVDSYESGCLREDPEYTDHVERFVLEERRVARALANTQSTNNRQ